MPTYRSNKTQAPETQKSPDENFPTREHLRGASVWREVLAWSPERGQKSRTMNNLLHFDESLQAHKTKSDEMLKRLQNDIALSEETAEAMEAYIMAELDMWEKWRNNIISVKLTRLSNKWLTKFAKK